MNWYEDKNKKKIKYVPTYNKHLWFCLQDNFKRLFKSRLNMSEFHTVTQITSCLLTILDHADQTAIIHACFKTQREIGSRRKELKHTLLTNNHVIWQSQIYAYTISGHIGLLLSVLMLTNRVFLSVIFSFLFTSVALPLPYYLLPITHTHTAHS